LSLDKSTEKAVVMFSNAMSLRYCIRQEGKGFTSRVLQYIIYQGLQPCNQDDTLNMGCYNRLNVRRAREQITPPIVLQYIVSVNRN